MALIPCPECGKMISNQAPSCPACGFPISQYVQQKSTLLQFGRYPQGGERIEWRVLERVDGRAYLISDKFDYETKEMTDRRKTAEKSISAVLK